MASGLHIHRNYTLAPYMHAQTKHICMPKEKHICTYIFLMHIHRTWRPEVKSQVTPCADMGMNGYDPGQPRISREEILKDHRLA